MRQQQQEEGIGSGGSGSGSRGIQQQQQQQQFLLLQNCVDNLKFRLGNDFFDGDEVDIFFHEYPFPTAFAVGDPHKTILLQQEIYQLFLLKGK